MRQHGCPFDSWSWESVRTFFTGQLSLFVLVCSTRTHLTLLSFLVVESSKCAANYKNENNIIKLFIYLTHLLCKYSMISVVLTFIELIVSCTWKIVPESTILGEKRIGAQQGHHHHVPQHISVTMFWINSTDVVPTCDHPTSDHPTCGLLLLHVTILDYAAPFLCLPLLPLTVPATMIFSNAFHLIIWPKTVFFEDKAQHL